jgi:hypothetical protein
MNEDAMHTAEPMIARLVLILVAAATLVSNAANVADAGTPHKVGACETTSILSIRQKFGEEPPRKSEADRGTAFELKNGVTGVDDGYVDDIAKSRIGDRVRTCLTYIPSDCPKGDERGKVYKTTNLRAHKSWELQDSSHSCGGA